MEKIEKPYWRETACENEINKVLDEFGIGGTKFVWPFDREVSFVIDDSEYEITTVPMFSLNDQTIGRNVVGHVRSYIDFCLNVLKVGDPSTLHFHYIIVDKYPELVGVFLSKGKRRPTTDFFKGNLVKIPTGVT